MQNPSYTFGKNALFSRKICNGSLKILIVLQIVRRLIHPATITAKNVQSDFGATVHFRNIEASQGITL